jgi:hypothetical protein
MPEKASKLMPALYGGIIMGVISGIPFLNFVNCFCCAGVLFGGFMAVFFYKKDLPVDGQQLTSSDGVQLGALAGVFGAIVGAVITGGLLMSVGNVAGEAMYKAIMGIYDSAGILDKMPPEAVEQMERGIMDGGFSIGQFILGMIVDVVFGLLGGLIGYAVFKPKATAVVPPAAPAV